MKITFLIVTFFFGLSAVAQDLSDITDSIKKETDIQVLRLKNVETLIKTEQSLLKTAAGSSDISQQIIKSLSKYASKKDSIIDKINKIKAGGIQKLKSVKLSKKLTSGAVRDKINDINDLAEEVTNPEVEILNDNSPKYLYLNGFNFDFNNTQKISYVGHLNIYIPAKRRWGYNTGIFKVNYQAKDTVHYEKNENVLKRPLETLAVDSVYSKQYNRYAVHTQQTSFSTYFQLLYKVKWFDDKIKRTNLYFHVHTELLATKYEINQRIKTIDQYNVTIASADAIPENPKALIVKERNFSTSLVCGYYGIGTTLDLKFLDNCSLFIQGTFGASIRHNDIDRTLSDIDPALPFNAAKYTTFYLVRSYFKYHVSPALQLVVGVDIRENMPHQQVHYATYVGINVGIDKLGELLK